METKELILRYGFVAGKRYKKSQKLRFLLGMTQEFQEMGYRTEAKQTEKKVLNNTNLYVGNISGARLLAESYYDTPPSCLKLFPYRFFSRSCRRTAGNLAVILPMLTIILIGVLFFTLAYVPLWNEGGQVSVAGAASLVFFLILLKALHSFRRGFGQKRNIVRNTSSLIALLKLAQEEKGNSDIAYVLTDNGCGSNVGADVLEQQKRRHQTCVHLDCVGAQGTLYAVYSASGLRPQLPAKLRALCQELTITPLNVDEHTCLKLDYFNKEDIYLLAGEYCSEGFILRKKQLLSTELQEDHLEKTVLFLRKFCKVLS